MTALRSTAVHNFQRIGDLAREKVYWAIHYGDPELAKQWTELAAIAEAAARGEVPEWTVAEAEDRTNA